MKKLTIRLILISAIIVAVTDAIVFYHLKNNPAELTTSFVILVIGVTIVPLAINIWYHIHDYDPA